MNLKKIFYKAFEISICSSIIFFLLFRITDMNEPVEITFARIIRLNIGFLILLFLYIIIISPVLLMRYIKKKKRKKTKK